MSSELFRIENRRAADDSVRSRDVRPRDPGVLQRIASNPEECAWVGASAGTGKTRVLTDRVLRLMLPRADGGAGSDPRRILCLTFTRAGAGEMAQRIQETLGRWAIMAVDHQDEAQSLRMVLQRLLGVLPTDEQISAAQRLFAEIIELPGGLQIMTIHSFCQSVLGRFPLEAGLLPNFSLMEETDAAMMLAQAQARALVKAKKEDGSALATALENVAAQVNEEQFLRLMRELCSERGQIQRLLRRFWDVDGIYTEVCRFYDILPQEDMESLLHSACCDEKFNFAGLSCAARILAQAKSEEEVALGGSLLRWLGLDVAERVTAFSDYSSIFLTKEDKPRSRNFPAKPTETANPGLTVLLRAEADRLLAVKDRICRGYSAVLTRDLLHLGVEILKSYEALKQAHAVLDYDDLVLRMLDLLQGNTEHLSRLGKGSAMGAVPWVMYKLDQGIDHILVDEAQDTNPEQWRIIELLCDEFFAGAGARDKVNRTSFVVGDLKQSIYSFQRAAPREFLRMQEVFDRKIREAKKKNNNVALGISFRSTKSVLQAVDAVFQNPALHKAVSGEVVQHESYRLGQAGRVEVWPVFESVKTKKEDYWEPPIRIYEQQSGAANLAEHIAEKIESWIGKEDLPAYGRKVRAGDIMILLRTRTAFLDQLVRGLKLKNIPVSGVDRMVLNEQLAVQDLLALARFCLLQEDDLTLACVLKSPLIGWDEDRLFEVAYGRKGSLWRAIRDFPQPDRVRVVVDYLKDLRRRALSQGPYEFFSDILNLPCPADARSGMRAIRGRLGEDALDPIGELLNAALRFGGDHPDTLQLFVDWQEQAQGDIKRELQEGGDQVRVMTVHGSKGLEAPIVILPDTFIAPGAGKMSRLLWPDKSGLTVPLWSPRADDDPEAYGDAYETCKGALEEEYYRLLYVAMTRAADRLYVAGYQGGRKPQGNSWYNLVYAALAKEPGVEALEDGTLRLENPQTRAPDKAEKSADAVLKDISLPDWLLRSAPVEPNPPRPLVPSRPADADVAVISPLRGVENYRFRRGNVTHKLLQFLPDMLQQNREETARVFVQKYASDLPADVQQSIVSEVMALLGNPDYAGFFGANSQAEVPVTGLIDGRIVSAQIDRLVVGEKDIWILDYKSNRPPPKDEKDIPEIYRKQLKAYRDAIAAIYPGRTIHCALLWTDGARLMVVC